MGKMSTAVTFLVLWLIHLIGVALIQDTFNDMEDAAAGGGPNFNQPTPGIVAVSSPSAVPPVAPPSVQPPVNPQPIAPQQAPPPAPDQHDSYNHPSSPLS